MKLAKNITVALEFEGMTSSHGLVIMDLFLKKAMAHHPDGLCFEFGTYKGRTAALIASHLGQRSWLHALEQADYLELERLMKISQSVTWHKSSSEQFCVEKLGGILGGKQVAFSHHDASHFFNNVKIELEELVGNMADYGIIVLDDFNDTFSQVRAAYYYLRYVCDFPYELLLIGFNKAILVHQDRFDYFENYVLNELQNELDEIEFSCKLCRSDINKFSRNFFLQLRADDKSDKLYGIKFWGERFYQPSKIYLKKTKKQIN